jgi:hypothetical protein
MHALHFQNMSGVDIKQTPTAQPESDDETIFYCPEYKKRFAESEMNAIQVENWECPEYGGKMDLHANPE